MKKLFLIPVLALVMGLAWTAVSTPDASARDYDRYDRHDRHDRHDRWDRDRDHRGHEWDRSHGKVHKWSPPGHKVRARARHQGHYKGYSKHNYHNKHRYNKRSRYIYDKYPRHSRYNNYRHGYGRKSENFSLSIILPVLDAFAGSSSYRY